MPTSKKMLAKARDIEKKLEALNGPEWASDSSDDEAAAPAKPQAAAPPQKPGRKQQKPKSEESRTIYLGHIPHGFYEKEMEGFFALNHRAGIWQGWHEDGSPSFRSEYREGELHTWEQFGGDGKSRTYGKVTNRFGA